MRIEPHYVTFEQAKLLNEKGFNEECVRFYVKSNSKIFGIDEHGRYYPIKNKPKKLWVVGNVAVQNVKNIILAPEQWQVVEWLRVNHGIWVYVVGGGNHQFYPIYQDKSGAKHEIMQFYYTPQEAYSAAIDYILKELI
jgi:hypothetical protein